MATPRCPRGATSPCIAPLKLRKAFARAAEGSLNVVSVLSGACLPFRYLGIEVALCETCNCLQFFSCISAVPKPQKPRFFGASFRYWTFACRHMVPKDLDIASVPSPRYLRAAPSPEASKRKAFAHEANSSLKLVSFLEKPSCLGPWHRSGGV